MNKSTLFTAVIVLAFCQTIRTQIPKTISYQGVLSESQVMVDGDKIFTFKLYEAESGGEAIWSEVKVLNVKGGVFEVVLGEETPLDLPFDKQYWLGVKVGSGDELSPRIPLTAAAYSLTSQSVADGAVVKSINHLKDNVTLAAGDNINITSTNNTLTISTDTVSVADAVWTESNGNIYREGGNVGIGIMAPDFPLHIKPGESFTGQYIDHDKTTPGWTYGLSVDVDNTFSGDSWAYGLYSSALKDNGTFGAVGVYGGANGNSAGDKYGVYGWAGGSGALWAGYFYGNVYASNVGIGTTTVPEYPLHIEPGENDRGLYINHDKTTSGNTMGIRVDVENIYAGDDIAEGVRSVVTKENGSAWVTGVYGWARGNCAGNKCGFYGHASGSGALYAGFFSGDVTVTGTLSKGAGSFKIDHPLDPENKYLAHSFVESPDMMNIYNGNITLDSNGEAWVELPEWFGSLNKDFRYQLTCIGGYAPVYIVQKIENNRFKIAGGQDGLEVSWQVTGIRQDPYAEKNRIQVEHYKTGNEVGRYLHPESYDLPEIMNIYYKQNMQVKEDTESRAKSTLKQPEEPPSFDRNGNLRKSH